jgi:hypothetical protein
MGWCPQWGSNPRLVSEMCPKSNVAKKTRFFYESVVISHFLIYIYKKFCAYLGVLFLGFSFTTAGAS